LFHASVGQNVEVDRPDAPPSKYVVTEYYPRWKQTDLRWLEPLDQEQLVLVTCTTYNENDPRIVVVARPS
jgi:sortase (surface protein transpeptidase)